MNEKMSMTAEVAAFVRAYHTAESGTICSDPLAIKLLGEKRYGQIADEMKAGRDWFLPGHSGTPEQALQRMINQTLGPVVLARTAWWEQELNREMRMGLRQVVLLGAGLESLPYRQTAEMERLNFYEVDTPTVMAEKEKRLQQAAISTPGNVHRVEADLTTEWEKVLQETSFDPQKRTLAALLGVVYYLPRPAMERLLDSLAHIMPRGSSLLFDCPMQDFGKEEDATAQQKELAQQAGEGMKRGYTLLELTLMLERYGFLIYEDLGAAEIEKRFYRAYNEEHSVRPVLPLPHTVLILAVRRQGHFAAGTWQDGAPVVK